MGESRIVLGLVHNIREKTKTKKMKRAFVFKKGREKRKYIFGEDKNETKEEINILKISEIDGPDFLEMEMIGRSEPLGERVCVTRTDFSFKMKGNKSLKAINPNF